MSKSIYEEVLDLIENIDRNLPYTWLMGRDNLMKIKQTVEQAQKQEKLLELYKKLNNLYEKLYTMELSELSLNSKYYEIEIIKLKQQIKELENNEK